MFIFAVVLVGLRLGSSEKEINVDESLNQTASLPDEAAKSTSSSWGRWLGIGSSSPQPQQPGAASTSAYTPRIGRTERFVRADFTLSESPSGLAEMEGEALDVFVVVGSTGQKLHLRPNQGREYPRVYVKPGETVSVRVEFSQSAPGTKVAVAPQDGGQLSARPSSVHEVDLQRAIAFDFTSGMNRGTHRVKLTTQLGEAHLLDFWVGAENRVRTAAAN